MWKAGTGDPSLNLINFDHTVFDISVNITNTNTPPDTNTADASGYNNFGGDISGAVPGGSGTSNPNLTYKTEDLSNNGILFKDGQKFTVMGWWGYHDSSNSVAIQYTDISKNFTTHKPPSI